jgi:hypothetical protein
MAGGADGRTPREADVVRALLAAEEVAAREARCAEGRVASAHGPSDRAIAIMQAEVARDIEREIRALRWAIESRRER